MTTSRCNLIVSPVAETSVHRSWLSDPESRTFDLFLINYGNQADFGRAEATHYLRRKGFKWELLHHVFANHDEILGRYANIWCPDSDIRVDTPGIDRLFELFERYHLQMAQPGIAKGEVSYRTLRQRPGVILRYTPFVECMCPLFTLRAFRQVATTFLENRSGWGLDLLWPRFFRPDELAIIDQVGVEHTGVLFRGEHYQRLAQIGIEPQKDFDAIVAKYGGFNERVHRQLLFDKIRLPAVREPSARITRLTRWAERLGLRRAVA
jgi:hypothetical protein